MKIALTSTGSTLDAPLDLHFGRAAHFLIYDTDSRRLVVVFNTAADAEQGAGPMAVEIVARTGAKILISGECGPRALAGLQAARIAVYTAAPGGASAPNGASALAQFSAGALREQKPL